ncbi:ribosome silencing factor [Leptolyngbya sp. FACHB-17]|uniref:ribosome silencing factor n=1 Tax=unclassified Leptolyngbya TaxID=2650499 RepID=UPI0016800FF8|nr:ribosome silencing factor [Leptolyngbya sp. FACHB-17]MBD2080319.1 ribosome silencing factor [Leptolyngbya sp. FACHB-17]
MTELSNQQTLSTPIANLDDRSATLARLAAEAADERKGSEIVLLKVGDVTVLADYFVMVTGYSKVQVRAIARSIEEKVEETMNRRPIRSEGFAEGSWIVEDYGDVIVHIMMPQEREYYGLESFWGHAARVPFVEF